jgi:cation diffusion facilitator CzcD-associated flavoprotein CzcO
MIDVPNRVCVIGAGSSGITASKVLKDYGIPFDCYEASDRVGGNWAYENPNIMS